MRTSFLLSAVLATLLSFAANVAGAQGYAFEWNPRTGDAAIDSQLADINRYAATYPEPFADELVRYFDAPRAMVVELMLQRWAPGDIYYACALAQGVGRPCRYVTDDWAAHHAEGWAAAAQRLGVDPASPQYQRIRRAFAASYARWGRPLPPEPAAGKTEQPDAARNGPTPRGAVTRSRAGDAAR